MKSTLTLYHSQVNFTRIGDFTWKASDCEELVGVAQRRDGVGFVGLLTETFYLPTFQGFSSFCFKIWVVVVNLV